MNRTPTSADRLQLDLFDEVASEYATQYDAISYARTSFIEQRDKLCGQLAASIAASVDAAPFHVHASSKRERWKKNRIWCWYVTHGLARARHVDVGQAQQSECDGFWFSIGPCLHRDEDRVVALRPVLFFRPPKNTIQPMSSEFASLSDRIGAAYGRIKRHYSWLSLPPITIDHFSEQALLNSVAELPARFLEADHILANALSKIQADPAAGNEVHDGDEDDGDDDDLD
jgi:hypothetical protein